MGRWSRGAQVVACGLGGADEPSRALRLASSGGNTRGTLQDRRHHPAARRVSRGQQAHAGTHLDRIDDASLVLESVESLSEEALGTVAIALIPGGKPQIVQYEPGEEGIAGLFEQCERLLPALDHVFGVPAVAGDIAEPDHGPAATEQISHLAQI